MQRKYLMDSLDEANRFLYTSEDARYASCERAIAKVASTLERLAEAWKVSFLSFASILLLRTQF